MKKLSKSNIELMERTEEEFIEMMRKTKEFNQEYQIKQLERIIEELRNENRKLKENNENLEDKYIHFKHEHTNICDSFVTGGIDCEYYNKKYCIDEIRKLKEKNKKLKKQFYN